MRDSQIIEMSVHRRPLWRRAIWKVWASLIAFWWRRRFAEFGRNSTIGQRSSLYGTHAIKIGSGVHVWHSGRIEAFGGSRSEPVLVIEDDTVVQPHCHIGAALSVVIGRGVMIASYVYITDHDHDFTNVEVGPRFSSRLIASPVEIGESVWIGEGAKILKGVRIGRRSVVAAGAVVTKDVPEWSIVAGVPAQVIRRFCKKENAWKPV